MAVQFEGQAQLGADAIGAGHQHRLLVTLRHLEQRPEPADPAQHAFAQRFLRERLDAIDEGVAGIDIDAGIAVGQGSGLGHG